jgi:hypothetical protein
MSTIPSQPPMIISQRRRNNPASAECIQVPINNRNIESINREIFSAYGRQSINSKGDWEQITTIAEQRGNITPNKAFALGALELKKQGRHIISSSGIQAALEAYNNTCQAPRTTR